MKISVGRENLKWVAEVASKVVKRTRWSLLNAFTETAKKYSAPRFDLCQRKLSELFRLDA